jgi:hypothetical protein
MRIMTMLGGDLFSAVSAAEQRKRRERRRKRERVPIFLVEAFG